MEQKNYSLTLIISAAILAGFLAGGFGALMVVSRIPRQVTVPGTTIKVNEESATVDVVKKVSPAVVTIIVSKEISARQFQQSQGFFFDPMPIIPKQGEKTEKHRVAGGSGFVVSADGMIMTNRHVVEDPDAEYTVVFSDGKELFAKVLALDPLNDIAFIKVDAHDLPTAELGDSTGIQIGQDVVAIGFALGEYQNSVTKGIISGINRKVIAGDGMQNGIIEGALQTDAAINEGNSGGPLINLAGQVIGINTAVSLQGQLIGFAIPVNTARLALDSLQKNGRIVRPWLGVRYIPISKEFAKLNELPRDNGAFILPSQRGDSGVVKASPAEKAGLKEKDIIFEIDGIAINESKSLASVIAGKNVGDVLVLKIQRGKEIIEKKVTLEEIKKQ